MLMFHRISPTEVVVPGISTDISENRPTVTLPSFRSTPNVIYQFMIIKGEVTGNIPMPAR